MVDVQLKCSCGTVHGTARNISPNTGTRLVCYCDDCQAFARYLGREAEILNEHGGTDIFQLTPAQIEITAGAEQIRCMRLTPKGMFRWYTGCCKTPIGNTGSAGLPFVGMVHNFMDDAGSRERNLGPVRAHVQTQFATGTPPSDLGHAKFPLRVILRCVRKMLAAKLRGQQRPSPFFDSTGTPVATPEILASGEERSGSDTKAG